VDRAGIWLSICGCEGFALALVDSIGLYGSTVRQRRTMASRSGIRETQDKLPGPTAHPLSVSLVMKEPKAVRSAVSGDRYGVFLCYQSV